MNVRRPAIALHEVPHSLFTPVPPEPRELPRNVIDSLTWEMQRDYFGERIETFNARAEAWGRRAEAWLWILWIIGALSTGYFVALITLLIVKVAS